MGVPQEPVIPSYAYANAPSRPIGPRGIFQHHDKFAPIVVEFLAL